MTAIISKWGNSQGLRFPKDIMKDLDLSIGDKVTLVIKDHKIIIEPIKENRKKYDIKDLVKKIPDNYKVYEEFDSINGVEKW